MKKPVFSLDFVVENWLPVTTVLLAVIVVGARSIHIIEGKWVHLVTLTLICFLTITGITRGLSFAREFRLKLEELPNRISVAEGTVREIENTDELMSYLSFKTQHAKHVILQASIDKRRTSATKTYDYDRVRQLVIESDTVHYKYLCSIEPSEMERRSGVLTLRDNKDVSCSKFDCRVLNEKTISLLNFVVIDDEEVIARQPYEGSGTPAYLIMSGTSVASLFTGYFERLWKQGEDPQNYLKPLK